jgi:hypothetical protein
MSKSFEEQNSPQPKQVHRISRRKALTTGAALAGSAIVGAGFEGFSAKNADALGSGTPPNVVVYQANLATTDPLRTRVFASPSMQSLIQKHGVDAITKNPIVHVKYANTSIEAISMSLQTASKSTRLVWAYFTPSSPEFKVLQFEFIPAGEMIQRFKSSNELVISGRATFFTGSDAVISSAIFRNDTLVSTARGAGLANVSNIGAKAVDLADVPVEDWECFADCLANAWNSLPGWLKWLCGATCGACLATINIIISCGACAGCIGGYAASCLWICR